MLNLILPHIDVFTIIWGLVPFNVFLACSDFSWFRRSIRTVITSLSKILKEDNTKLENYLADCQEVDGSHFKHFILFYCYFISKVSQLCPTYTFQVLQFCKSKNRIAEVFTNTA